MWPFAKKFGGLIAGHGLDRWWGSLTQADRQMANDVTSRPMSAYEPLDSGPPRKLKGTKSMLVSLAGWFERDEHRALGRKIMAHAATLPHDAEDIIELHLMLNSMIGFYYRCRKDGDEFLPKCEHACREMISIAKLAAKAFKDRHPKSPLPCHLGYGRLAWLLEKRNDPEASELRREGEKHGWIVTI